MTLFAADVLYGQRFLAAGGFDVGRLDGRAGPRTRAAWAAFDAATAQVRAWGGTYDAASERNIATMLPTAQAMARVVLHIARSRGWDVRVTSGTRTHAEQAVLYARGRTTPGNIVTNARPGSSWHNYGAACDVSVFTNGHYEARDLTIYKALGAAVLADVTWPEEWGGRWVSIKDWPHYQLTGGHSIAQVRKLWDAGTPFLPATAAPALHPWRPIVTRDFVGDPDAYEYAPEALLDPDGVVRLFACVGLGDDTISTVRLDGAGMGSWRLPDPSKLVSDPSVTVYGDRLLLLFTVGDKAGGTNNGISGQWCTQNGAAITWGAPFVVLPQAGGAGTYGVGQPTVAARPGCPTLLLHTDTRGGRNRLVARHLEVLAPGGPVTAGPEYAIPVDDDGASCSAWWDAAGLLHVLIVGDGKTGIRTFRLDGTTLRSAGRAPGGFWTSVVADTPGAVDGAGILRGRDAQPVITGGRLEVWQGRAGPTLGSWGLHRFLMPTP